MKVAVVKYNAGNIRSVDYALKRLGVEAVITADEAVLRAADKVIFPGVGEAETTMDFLRAGGMDRLIKELRQPVLGICLGMQLMCRHSEEGDVDFICNLKADFPKEWTAIIDTRRLMEEKGDSIALKDLKIEESQVLSHKLNNNE